MFCDFDWKTLEFAENLRKKACLIVSWAFIYVLDRFLWHFVVNYEPYGARTWVMTFHNAYNRRLRSLKSVKYSYFLCKSLIAMWNNKWDFCLWVQIQKKVSTTPCSGELLNIRQTYIIALTQHSTQRISTKLSMLFNLTNWIFRFVNQTFFFIFQKAFFLFPSLLWFLISFMNIFSILLALLFILSFVAQGGNHKINWFFYYTLKSPLKVFSFSEQRNFLMI